MFLTAEFVLSAIKSFANTAKDSLLNKAYQIWTKLAFGIGLKFPFCLRNEIAHLREPFWFLAEEDGLKLRYLEWIFGLGMLANPKGSNFGIVNW